MISRLTDHRFGAMRGGCRRILFVGEAVSLSPVVRPLALAQWTREAGYEVGFACGPAYAGLVRAAGFEPQLVPTISGVTFHRRVSRGSFFYSDADLQEYVRAEMGLIRAFQPDMVVGDFRLTLPISAELTGVKCLSLANAYWSPAFERRLPAPEAGPFGLLPRLLRDRLFDVLKPLAYRYFAAPLDRVRRSFGLPAFDDFRKHYTAGNWCAYLDLPELVPVASPPRNHFFLGPVIWQPTDVPRPDRAFLDPGRPIAYVSVGASGDGRRLPDILRELLSAGCNVTVSGLKPEEAGYLRRELPELAGRSFIAEFFSPAAVLSRAALTVCHGGSGTVYQSLEQGVPVLCFPSNQDQRLVSEAVELAGAGLITDGRRLGRQVSELLAGRGVEAARRIGRAMRGHDTRGRWLSFLAELPGGRLRRTDVRPVKRRPGQRVLLVNSNRFKQPWPVIPFGLCCVASAVEQAGHEVRVLDLCFAKNPARAIERAVKEFRPDVVGVSIRNIDNSAGFNTLFLLDDVRDNVISPLIRAFDGPVVLGGPAVGVNGAEMLEFFGLDLAIRGDGEAAMVELLRRLESGESLEGLGGLVHRSGGRVVEDNPPLCMDDLDSLPPARPWKWLNLSPYSRAGAAIQIQTKRGCALGCTYCTYNRIEGRSWRLRSPARVADEIAEAVRESGLDLVEFTDSTFNIPLDHCKAVLRELISRGLDVRFRTMGLNPGAVDEELADLLRAARFREVDLGVEAGCDATLRGLGKNFRKDSVLRAGELLRQRGIPVTWYLLVGGPSETVATLAETFATVSRAAGPWDLVNVGVGLRVYNGSPIAERMRREGAPEAAGNFFRPAAYRPADMTLDEVKALTKREALRHANWFMYDEDEKMPLLLVILGTLAFRLLAPRHPLWRLFILMRKAQMLSGVNALRRLRAGRPARRQSPTGLPAMEPCPKTVAVHRDPVIDRVPLPASASRREVPMRASLTEHLRFLEEQLLPAPVPEHFTFGGSQYTIRVANDLESRRKAYQLVYKLYLEKEYAQPHPSKMWLSIFDALPETVTLLVERQAEGTTGASSVPSAFGLQSSACNAPVGALTVIFDSPMGLPADQLYRPELDALRASGRKLSEIVSLGVSEEAGTGSEILVKLFNFVYLLSKKVRGATDFMITVNPRHVRFYEKTLLFAEAGPERSYDKVGGAPALLLRLDLAVPQERVRMEHGPAETRPARSRTLYPMFHAPAEEQEIVAGLATSLRPMTRQEFGCFFVTETDILARATPEQRTWIEGCYWAAGRTA